MSKLPVKPWMAHYDKHVLKDVPIPTIAIPGLLDKAVLQFQNKDFLIFDNVRLSFKDVGKIANNFAQALISKGMKPGDKVALILPNIPQFVIAYLGTMKAGGIVIAMNPNYKQPELEYLFTDSQPDVVICLPEHLDKIASFAQSIKILITTAIGDIARISYFEKIENLNTDTENNFLSLCFAEQAATNLTLPVVGPDDPAIFQYTGGTTGIPKAAIGLHRNIIANTYQFANWCDLSEGEEVILGVIPLYHVYGMVLAMNLALHVGGSLVLIDDPTNLDRILEVIQQYRITFYPGVPTMYYAINQSSRVRTGEVDLSSIKACISGAAPLHPKIKSAFEEFTGSKLIEGYGLSEAPTATHCNPLYGENKSGSIGMPLPGVDCKIVDLEVGQVEMKTGEIGEMVIKGPQVMQGYYHRQEESQNVLRDGWLYTGDVARMDEDGYFHIIDRKKSLIKVSGFQVWPNEVETVLNSHMDILESAVGGVPEMEHGEKVIAWVVCRPGSTITENVLVAYCRSQLADYKIPSEVIFVDKIPRTGVGKILRRELILDYRREE